MSWMSLGWGSGGLAAPHPSTGSLAGPHLPPHLPSPHLHPPLWGPHSTPRPIAWGASSCANGAAAGLGHRGGVPMSAPLAPGQPPASPLPVPTQGTHGQVAQRMRCHLPRGKKEESGHPQGATSTGWSQTDPRPPPNCGLPVCPCSPPAGSGAVGRVWGALERCQPLGGCPAAPGRGAWCGEAVTLPASASAQRAAAPLNQAS